MDTALKTVAFISTLLTVIFAVSWCSPPAHSENNDLGPWFKSLTIPGTQMSCCDISDCQRVQSRETPEGYEALINGEWMKVPEAAILNRMSNPTGSAIACYLPSRGIMCFVRPSEV